MKAIARFALKRPYTQPQAKMNEIWETESRAKAGRMGRALSATFLALVVTMATGCVPKPPMGMARPPNRVVPDSFAGLGDTRNSGLIPWRNFFEDAHLVALVDAALQNNQELNIAIQETVVANAEIMARRGEYLPKVGFGAGTGAEPSAGSWALRYRTSRVVRSGGAIS